MADGVLFVHHGFPGQFRPLAEALVARGVKCAAIGHHDADEVAGVPLARYGLPRGSTPGIYAPAMNAEGDFIRGSIVCQTALALKAEGFDPEVIVGHAHWGETVFLDQVFPNARQVLYPEFFSRGEHYAETFDPEFQPGGLQARLLAKSKAAVMALELCDAAAIVVPTAFQAATLPEVFRPLTRIIHEGVDVEALAPRPARRLVLPGGAVIEPGTPVITHVNNHLEPVRGLHILARALPRVLAEVPEAQVLVIGREDAGGGYTGEPPDGLTWKQASLRGVDLDPARVHFLGWTDHGLMQEALRASTAHVYYTYPFVLSWSLVEAMALGCYVIASDTAPLHDAIEDGVNGRLLPFHDVGALAGALIAACRDPEASRPLRAAARATAVSRFSRQDSLAAWFALLAELGLKVPA